MPEIKFPSKWLKAKEDVNQGDFIRFMNTGVQDKDERWVFTVGVIKRENPGLIVAKKDFSLNKTNFNAIAAVYGSNSDNWLGKDMRVSIIRVQNQKGELVP